MKLSILVPFRPDGGSRERAWDWIERRIALTLPEAEVVTAGAEYAGDSQEHFEHSRALNEAFARSTGDILLIEDADTAFDPRWVRAAVRLVATGHVPWLLTSRYEQLTRESTDTVLDGAADDPIDVGLEKEWTGLGVSWAGLIVLPREAFETVGGYDERFSEWGADDVAFAMALRTLWGPHERLAGAATHLWHPRAGLDAQPTPQHELMNRYLDASGDRARMRTLVRA